MKEIKKLSKVLINYTENLYKITYSIKMNMKVYVKLLLNMSTKLKMIPFYEYNIKLKLNLFSLNK